MAVKPIPIVGEVKPGTKEYFRLHMRIRRELGSPSFCEVCGATDRGIDWANISGKYLEDSSDFAALCKPCHRSFDGHTGLKTLNCYKGHLKIGDNLLIIRRPNRPTIEYGCKTCYRESSKSANRRRRANDKLRTQLA